MEFAPAHTDPGHTDLRANSAPLRPVKYPDAVTPMDTAVPAVPAVIDRPARADRHGGEPGQMTSLFSHYTDPSVAKMHAGPLRPPGHEDEQEQEPEPQQQAQQRPHAPPKKRKPRVVSHKEVSNQITDGPYGWTSAYDFEKLSDKSTRITIRVKINMDASVTATQVQKVKTQTQNAFQRYWDRKFNLIDKDKGTHPLATRLLFTDDNPHLSVQLHPSDGRDDLSNWFVDSNANDRAHELGHQLGLKDEYVDEKAPDRATATSPGVHNDHSIMGDYYGEGLDEATVKQRHGNVLAEDISSATGESYTAQRVVNKKKGKK